MEDLDQRIAEGSKRYSVVAKAVTAMETELLADNEDEARIKACITPLKNWIVIEDMADFYIDNVCEKPLDDCECPQ